MAPEDKKTYTLYIDGVEIPSEQIREIRLSIQEPEPKSLLSCNLEITVQVKPPKRWYCRGRKRFVKLMMSEGISRNYAGWLADFTRELMPYKDAWGNYLLHGL